MKKMLALFLAVLMTLGLAAPAFAAETASATMPEGLVDAVLYGEPEHENFVLETIYASDEQWIAAHPELVADFRAGGWRDFAVAYYGGNYILEEVKRWWDSEEAAIDEFLYQWAWEMAWVENYVTAGATLKAEDPALYAEYAVNADAYFNRNLWHNSKDAFKSYYYGITDEQFVDIMIGHQIEDARWEQEKIDTIETYRSEHPGELEAIDWDAYFAEEYYWYYSIEEFMRSYELATLEDFYAYMQYEYVSQINWRAELAVLRAEAVRQKRLDLGMSETGHALVVNGEVVSFSQPMTIRHNNLYAPATELTKAIGFTGSYADLLVDGQVPVRLTAERAGYTVLWDELMDAAVLIDMGKIAAELDEQFAVLNRAMARAHELQAKDGSGSMGLNLTMFDTLNGDKTYTAKLAYTFGFKNETTYWFRGSLTSPNFADFAEMFKGYLLAEMYYYYSDEEIAQYEKLFTTLAALKSIEFAVEYNTETGYATISLPLISTLAKIMGETAEPTETFFVGKTDIAEMSTIGGLLAQTALSMAVSDDWSGYDFGFEYNDSPVYYWEKMTAGLPEGMDFFADGAFERKGSEDVLEMTLVSLIQALIGSDDDYADYYIDELTRMFSKFNLFLAINDKGESRLSFEMRTDIAALTGMYSPISMDAEMTVEGKNSGNTQESTVQVHVKNTFKLELKSKVVYK